MQFRGVGFGVWVCGWLVSCAPAHALHKPLGGVEDTPQEQAPARQQPVTKIAEVSEVKPVDAPAMAPVSSTQSKSEPPSESTAGSARTFAFVPIAAGSKIDVTLNVKIEANVVGAPEHSPLASNGRFSVDIEIMSLMEVQKASSASIEAFELTCTGGHLRGSGGDDSFDEELRDDASFSKPLSVTVTNSGLRVVDDQGDGDSVNAALVTLLVEPLLQMQVGLGAHKPLGLGKGFAQRIGGLKLVHGEFSNVKLGALDLRFREASAADAEEASFAVRMPIELQHEPVTLGLDLSGTAKVALQTLRLQSVTLSGPLNAKLEFPFQDPATLTGTVQYASSFRYRP